MEMTYHEEHKSFWTEHSMLLAVPIAVPVAETVFH